MCWKNSWLLTKKLHVLSPLEGQCAVRPLIFHGAQRAAWRCWEVRLFRWWPRSQSSRVTEASVRALLECISQQSPQRTPFTRREPYFWPRIWQRTLAEASLASHWLCDGAEWRLLDCRPLWKWPSECGTYNKLHVRMADKWDFTISSLGVNLWIVTNNGGVYSNCLRKYLMPAPGRKTCHMKMNFSRLYLNFNCGTKIHKMNGVIPMYLLCNLIAINLKTVQRAPLVFHTLHLCKVRVRS